MAIFGVPEATGRRAPSGTGSDRDPQPGRVEHGAAPRRQHRRGAGRRPGSGPRDEHPVSVARQLEQAAPAKDLLGRRRSPRPRRRDFELLPDGTGRHARVPAARARPRRAVVRAHLEAPLVDRQRELMNSGRVRLVAAERDAVYPIVGEAGIGKSRLANRLCAVATRPRSCADVVSPTVRRPRTCRSRGSRAGGWRSDRAARRRGLDRRAPERPQLPRKLAAERPVVLVLEDVHWAGPTLLDLVEYLGGRSWTPLVSAWLGGSSKRVLAGPHR
jgi:hypothetical protein